MTQQEIRSAEHCDVTVIHQEVVDHVAARMPDENKLADLADLFKMFGDTTRIRILRALEFSEMCVCDIAQLLSMSQSAISHQLRVLKQAKLVRNRREGKVVYYALDDAHVQQIIDQGWAHILEERG